MAGFGLPIQHHQAQGPVYRDTTQVVLGRFNTTRLRLEALFAKKTGSGEIANVHYQKSRKKDGSRETSGSLRTHGQGLSSGQKNHCCNRCEKSCHNQGHASGARSSRGGRHPSQGIGSQKGRTDQRRHQSRKQNSGQKSHRSSPPTSSNPTQSARRPNATDAPCSLALPDFGQALIRAACGLGRGPPT